MITAAINPDLVGPPYFGRVGGQVGVTVTRVDDIFVNFPLRSGRDRLVGGNQQRRRAKLAIEEAVSAGYHLQPARPRRAGESIGKYQAVILAESWPYVLENT